MAAPLSSKNWPWQRAGFRLFSQVQCYYSHSALPCKGGGGRNPLRQSTRFFGGFFSDVCASFFFQFLSFLYRIISCENWLKSQQGSSTKFMTNWGENPPHSFCREKRAPLQASFDAFPAFSFIRRVLARFFLFVYNQTRIEKHLFLQSTTAADPRGCRERYPVPTGMKIKK